MFITNFVAIVFKIAALEFKLPVTFYFEFFSIFYSYATKWQPTFNSALFRRISEPETEFDCFAK